ncbi:MAG: hypothetical protein OEZ38_05395 [Gammaproteobacteria bacterium]|nr:hypothetical protein [Gammaproteobacteria bacterium]
MLNENKALSIGEHVRIKSTGQKVTIEQLSDYGFAVVKFSTGGKHRLLNNKLEKIQLPEFMYQTD